MDAPFVEPKQEERELSQAILVQRMSAQDRWAWWSKEFAAVQAQAQLLMQCFSAEQGAKSFASMAEKNRHDEGRELEQALHHSLFTQSCYAVNSR